MDCFSGGGEIKSFSSRQFGNPLMYCGGSIHATWTASSEGPVGVVGTGLAEGGQCPLRGLHEEWEQTQLRGDSVLCGPAGGVGTDSVEGGQCPLRACRRSGNRLG